MNDLTFSVLLEFLYNRFAVTFVMCFVGSWMRGVFMNNKNERKIFDIKRVVISTLFSTFLMCACSVYLNLKVEVYILLSVLCGMWGLAIMKLVMSENFLLLLVKNFSKKVADPIVKGTMEAVTQVSEQKDTEKDKNE